MQSSGSWNPSSFTSQGIERWLWKSNKNSLLHDNTMKLLQLGKAC